MPFNGAGSFSPPGADYPAVANTLIEAAKRNAIDADFATGLSTAICKDGQTVITANIPMASHKFTGLSAGSSAGDSVRYEQVTSFAGLVLVPLPRSYLSGLGMSNNGTATKLDVAAGACRDSTNVANIVLTAAITAGLIQTSGSWAAGSTQNKLDTGARANSTLYHVYAIRKDLDGTADWLFSLSASSPTMPSGYTYFRRIGSVLTDISGNITAFTQDGDYFRWTVNVNDISATNPGTSAVTRTLTVPTGVNVTAFGAFDISDTSADTRLYLSDLATTDVATSGTNAIGANQVANQNGFSAFQVRTNTSAQIRSRLSASGAGTSLSITTFGWIDRRGRDA